MYLLTVLSETFIFLETSVVVYFFSSILLKIENEEERVSAIYEIFDEDSRLSSKATRVEFLTTVRQIEKYLKQVEEKISFFLCFLKIFLLSKLVHTPKSSKNL